MGIQGERVKRTRLIRGGRFVVAVEVEMVIPPDDPGEPCYEAETVRFLHEVAERARGGDREWLRRQGTVYRIGRTALPIPRTRTLILFPRLPRLTVGRVMAAVAIVALIFARVHSRETAHTVKHRDWWAQRHELDARWWSGLVGACERGRMVVKEVQAGRPSDSEEARYVIGKPPFASGRSYSESELRPLDASRSAEVCRARLAFHEDMAGKWRRASRSPGTPVEPDPPRPWAGVDDGMTGHL